MPATPGRAVFEFPTPTLARGARQGAPCLKGLGASHLSRMPVPSAMLLGLAHCLYRLQPASLRTNCRACGRRKTGGGHTMRSIRLPIPLLAAAALIALPSFAAAAQGAAPTAAPPASPPAQTAPGFVGSEICVSCHTAEAEHLA